MNTFPASANKLFWQPACSLKILKRRAELLDKIRAFFRQAGVLEVETPQLWSTTAIDPHLTSFEVDGEAGTLYLQTSPEFAMKRLLAAGSGSIYQICKAFRRGEVGRLHNPEFTLLEWYRVGFDLPALMDEVAALLQELLGRRIQRQVRFSYGELFQECVGAPWQAPLSQLEQRAKEHGFEEAAVICGRERSLWLDFLFSHVVQAELPKDTLVFVCDYPAELAAMARLKPNNPEVAERFEVFVNGVELANGYRELSDPVQQRVRFEVDLAKRGRLGLSLPPIDQAFLAALAAGFPDCSGVALGVDRVLMLAEGCTEIGQVLAFPLRQ